MPKHPYAENMALYAQDAMETDKPWERWQFRVLDGDPWVDCTVSISWGLDLQYRRKPRTITINGYEVPEPVREPLAMRQKYFFPCISNDGLVDWFHWGGYPIDNRLLGRGLIHLTEEAACAHAEALLSFTKKEENK